jgi:glycosyltransferase involved in cell wall biosynthesis
MRWPTYLPRQLRHIFYDNFLFPRAIRSAKPDLIFTPYHDVRLPSKIPSVLMVHDTCLHDLPQVYPKHIRGYYLHMLKRNLQVTSEVLTVSGTSRKCIEDRYGVPNHCICVIPNAIEPVLSRSNATIEAASHLRQSRNSGLHLFYPGGSEHRKNISRLAEAVAAFETDGTNIQLWITGDRDRNWDKVLNLLQSRSSTQNRFHFLGKLDMDQIAAEYLACDVVVYPTLCEGFGRVALEAMELGVPLACSNLPVLREVAGEYPHYFDPLEIQSMVEAIKEAEGSCRDPQQCSDYLPATVAAAFLKKMDSTIAKLKANL